MFSGLKPYAEYKGSGVPWLGRVPTGWPVKRVKALLGERSSKGFPTEPLLAATQSAGVVRKQDYESRTVTAQKDLHLLKLVEAGDFVISLRSFQGGIERAHYRGIISPAYTVLYPRNGADRNYLSLVFKSRRFVDGLTLFITGIREGQSIDYQLLSRNQLPAPQQAEQAAIVRFLDHANSRIGRAITGKQKMLSLLDEQKGAVVQEAVTAGLDATVDRHSSSSNWFPSLPAGWEMTTLGRLVVSAIDGPHFSPEYLDDGVPFLSARNVKEGHWDFSDVKYVSPEDFELFSKRVKPELGDVLYTKGGTTGVARVVDLTFPFQIWVHVAVLKPHKKLVTPDYLAMTLNSPRCYEQSQLYTRGATNQDLGLSRMKRIELPLPPSLNEQGRVVQHVRHQVDTLLTAATRVVREIELLREFRTRLTSDAVTGQLDVCEAAAKLPDLDLTELATVDIDDSDDIDAVAEEFLDEDEP